MILKIFPSIFLMFTVHAKIENDFLTDYFDYKKVSIIAGFSCNSIEDDFSLINNFSKRGILTVLDKLNNIEKLTSILKVNYWKIGIFFDIRCYDSGTITSTFLEASDSRMFDELRYWLIIGSNLAKVLNVIDDRAFGISTDLVIAVPTDDENYMLHDAYNVFKDRGTTLNVSYFGTWNVQKGLNVKLIQSKFRRRSNLHRLRLKAIFYKSDYKKNDTRLEDYFENNDNIAKEALAKFSFHLLSHLALLHNFTLELYESSEWKEGDAIGPVIHALGNNTADITGTSLTMNIARISFVKFVHQDFPFRTCFIFRNPQAKRINLHEILKPLADEVWYALLIFLNLVFAVLLIILKNESIKPTFVKISNALLIMIGALCQQGTDEPMTRISTRISFLFVMVFSLLMYNYYSASVVSARLGEPIIKINDSLVELGKLHLKMSSEPLMFLDFLLKKPDWETNQFYKKYWLKLPASSQFMMPEEGMRLVKEGGFAYHTAPEVGYPIIDKLFDNREICELMEVHLAKPTYTTFGVTINSSIVEIARVGLTKISETGLKYRQIAKWQYRRPQCRKDVLSVFSVTFYEFAPHLLLLMLGIIIALFTYIIELFVANYGCYTDKKLVNWRKRYFSRERFVYD